MERKPAIFISIASYRDPELIPTLRDLIEKASGCYRLAVAVCWQDDGDHQRFQQAGMTLCSAESTAEYDLLTWHYLETEIRMISLHYLFSKGACWARNQCETFYREEEYVLQIDSHCRFVEGWDREIVAMLEALKAQSRKPVLSSYPPGYVPGKEEEKTQAIFRLVFRGFSSDKIVQLTSVDFQQAAPVRGSYLAGGFIFAEGRFVKEVPNDPQIFFEGEEIAMAARAFTHGYDVWHPHKIVLWHFYGREEASRIWGDHNDEAKNSGSVDRAWHERDSLSKKRVRILLGMEQAEPADMDRYGLGSRRTLAEFEAALGISFTKLAVLPEVLGPERVAWFPPPYGNWRERLSSHQQKTIGLTQEEFTSPLADITCLHIGVYSNANDLLYKKILSGEEINECLAEHNGEEIAIALDVTFPTTFTPAAIRFSAYDDSEGWSKVVEKAW